MTTEAEKTRDRLLRKLNVERQALEKADKYVENEQPLKYLSPILERELDYRVAPIIVGIPRYAVEVYDHRLDIQGFSITGQPDSASRDMWEWWQAVNGPFQSQQAHEEALSLGRSYAIVGPNEEDAQIPVLTMESPFDAIHEDNPVTHDVEHGIKVWTDLDRTRWVSLYTPNTRQTWYRKKGAWVEDTGLFDQHNHGVCHLTPLINRPRMLGRFRAKKFDQRLGRPVFHQIITLADGLNKSLWDMMVSSEFHGLPRRWATGLSEKDFVDQKTDEALETFSMIAGRIWASENENAKFGQFPEAELTGFHSTIKLLIQVSAMLLGLPADFLTFVGDNPTSADAIRASEAQLVKRAERMQTALATQWERVQRLRALEMGKPDDKALRQIEVNWVDAATPTVAQRADAVTKLLTTKDPQGRSVIPLEQARIDLGYSETDRENMRKWDREALQDPYLDDAMKDRDERPAGGE